jgi:hypothetical protein
MSVKLFRYRGTAKDGGTLEYIFEAGDQNSPNAVTKEKAAEIAADFMTTFIKYRWGRWKLRNFGQRRSGSGPSAFSDMIKGPMRELYFVVLLPDGTVVVPRWRGDCRHGTGLLFLARNSVPQCALIRGSVPSYKLGQNQKRKCWKPGSPHYSKRRLVSSPDASMSLQARFRRGLSANKSGNRHTESTAAR